MKAVNYGQKRSNTITVEKKKATLHDTKASSRSAAVGFAYVSAYLFFTYASRPIGRLGATSQFIASPTLPKTQKNRERISFETFGMRHVEELPEYAEEESFPNRTKSTIGDILLCIKAKTDVVRVPDRLYAGQALFTLLSCCALDLGHRRLKSFVRNLLWIAVLGIVIHNNDRVIKGYEEKVACIYTTQQDVTLDIISSFSVDYSRHFQHFIRSFQSSLRISLAHKRHSFISKRMSQIELIDSVQTLSNQNWTLAMSNSLKPIDEAADKLVMVIRNLNTTLNDLQDELDRIRGQATFIRNTVNALATVVDNAVGIMGNILDAISDAPDPLNIFGKIRRLNDKLQEILAAENVLLDHISYIFPSSTFTWTQPEIDAMLYGVRPSPGELIDGLLREAQFLKMEFSSDAAWSNATIDFEPLTTHLAKARAEWESIQTTLRTIRNYLYIVTALSAIWMFFRNLRLVFVTKERPPDRKSVKGMGGAVSSVMRQSVMSWGVIVFTIALFVLSKGMFDTASVILGAPQPEISLTAGMDAYIKYSSYGANSFYPLLKAWENAIPSFSTFLDVSTRECQVYLGSYDWSGLNIVVALGIVFSLYPIIGMFTEPLQRVLFTLPVFWLADKPNFISRGTFDRCFKRPEDVLDVKETDDWMDVLATKLETKVKKRRLSPDDIEKLSTKVAIVLAALQSAAEFEDAGEKRLPPRPGSTLVQTLK